MHLRITTQPTSVAILKMAGIFTKRIWQPYLQHERERPDMKRKYINSYMAQ